MAEFLIVSQLFTIYRPSTPFIQSKHIAYVIIANANLV